MTKVEKKIIKKKFEGIVVSDKLEKTIIVKTSSTKLHPKYFKRYITSKKYKVHDPSNEYKKGEKVAFTECRPISKDKRWRVMPKAKKSS
ncbi:MAG: 30S ribosomal protein S17 [Patescibacteria group bacterium]|jgi:small subunit ribosomal protein S17